MQGIIQRPPNLSTWDDVPIKAILESEFQAECLIENDANAGAVAEHRFGAGRAARTWCFSRWARALAPGSLPTGGSTAAQTTWLAKWAIFA